jgi:hypothetical protein
MAINLPSYSAFVIVEDASLATRWKDWLEGFEAMITAMQITDEEHKRAMLLHYGGTDIRKLIEKLDNAGNEKEYKKARDALNSC